MIPLPLLETFADIRFTPPVGSAQIILLTLLLLILCVLLGLSAFMSSSETSFFSLTPAEVTEIKESNSPKDRKLLQLMSRSEQLLATILIGNNVVNVTIVMLAGVIIARSFDFSATPVLGFVLETVVLSFLLLLFGEIIPKVYAQRNPLKFIRSIATPIHFVFRFLSPAAKGLMKIVPVGSNKGKHSSGAEISVDDLSNAVKLTTDKKDKETEMIHDIIRFYNKTTDEIMVPRIDVVDVDISLPFTKMLSTVLASGYSRIPVYEGSDDNIKGLLYVKDMIPYMDEGDDFNWQRLLRPAYFVPEKKKIDDLLEELRHEHIHMAIVVDEFGGTGGIVTLEDILEEIVGDIADEYDEEEVPYIKLAENIYLFEGRTSLTDLCKVFDWEPDFFEPILSDADTLGGLFLELRRDIPKEGEIVHYKNLALQITKMDRFRILQIQLTIEPQGAVHSVAQ